MNIGDCVKSFREKSGLSQVELAEQIGITQSMLCQIERGTKVPSLPLSIELANALNCSISDLCNRRV